MSMLGLDVLSNPHIDHPNPEYFSIVIIEIAAWILEIILSSELKLAY